MTTSATKTPCERAIDDACTAAGSGYRLMRALGFRSPGTITSWRTTGRIPAGRVMQVSAVTGIPPERLRPDLYTGFVRQSPKED